MYLLDANVLIDAKRNYYPIESVPEFWDWLVYQGEQGLVKLPPEIHDELIVGKDELADWAKSDRVRYTLILDEEADIGIVRYVVDEGYAPDLNDAELDQLGNDPFLISYALNNQNRIVVTTENSSPRKLRAHKKVPDVCDHFSIRHCHPFQFYRLLNFRTSWDQEL